MSTDESERTRLPHAELPIPTSVAPSIDTLKMRVAGRRRRRTLVRGATAGVIAAVSLLSIFALQPDRNNVADPIVPDESSIVALPQSGSMSVDSVKTPKPDAEALNPPASDKLRLFARVRGHVPVLQVDHDAQRISVVGWVEAEQSIPVDMRYVPGRQQETFNAVLHGDADHISL